MPKPGPARRAHPVNPFPCPIRECQQLFITHKKDRLSGPKAARFAVRGV